MQVDKGTSGQRQAAPVDSSSYEPLEAVDGEIERRLADFKRLLADTTRTDIEIVRSRIANGTPYAFRNDPEAYHAIREEVSHHFEIHSQDTLLVGSGHLGFSLSPSKLWRAFNSESDLDMVVISDRAFVSMWEKTYAFSQLPRRTGSELEETQFGNFRKFHFKGRIFPPLLPVAYRTEWFDYFNSIYGKFLGRKVTGTIFFNRHFFEQYHVKTIRLIRAGLATRVEEGRAAHE